MTPAPDAATGVSDPTIATTDPATTDTDQSPSADDSEASTFSKCKVEMYKSLSTMGKGSGMLLKGFSQAALTLMGALFGAFNGLLSITATTGDTVAKGVNLVNKTTGSILVVGDLTSGVSKLVTHMADVNHDDLDYLKKNNDKLFNLLDNDLDNYYPESKSTTGEGDADGKLTDTKPANAAAPATDEPTQNLAMKLIE